MQKLVFTEGINGVEELNKLLDDGWQVKQMNCSSPKDDSNIQSYILLEKEDNL